MFRRHANAVPTEQVTHQGARFDAPWEMTTNWMRVIGFAILAASTLLAGVISAAVLAFWPLAAIGVLLALPLSLVSFILWRFVRRTERMVYPDQAKYTPGGPTVIWLRDSMSVGGERTHKDPQQVDIGLKPQEALRAMRYIKTSGETSRRKVVPGAQISQTGWAKLNEALHSFGIIDASGKIDMDELDDLIGQIEAQVGRI